MLLKEWAMPSCRKPSKKRHGSGKLQLQRDSQRVVRQPRRTLSSLPGFGSPPRTRVSCRACLWLIYALESSNEVWLETTVRASSWRALWRRRRWLSIPEQNVQQMPQSSPRFWQLRYHDKALQGTFSLSRLICSWSLAAKAQIKDSSKYTWCPDIRSLGEANWKASGSAGGAEEDPGAQVPETRALLTRENGQGCQCNARVRHPLFESFMKKHYLKEEQYLYVKEVQYLQPVILDRGLVLLTDHCLMDLAWLAKWKPRELRKCKRSSKRSRNLLSGEKQSRRKRPCHRAREEGPWWRPWRAQFQCKWLACRLASACRRSLPQPLLKSQPPHLLLSQLSVQLNRQWFPNFCRLHFARVTFQGKETSGSQSTTTWCLACCYLGWATPPKIGATWMWPLQQPGRKGKSQCRPDGLCFALCLIASLPREALLGGKNTRATKKTWKRRPRSSWGARECDSFSNHCLTATLWFFITKWFFPANASEHQRRRTKKISGNLGHDLPKPAVNRAAEISRMMVGEGNDPGTHCFLNVATKYPQRYHHDRHDTSSLAAGFCCWKWDDLILSPESPGRPGSPGPFSSVFPGWPRLNRCQWWTMGCLQRWWCWRGAARAGEAQ